MRIQNAIGIPKLDSVDEPDVSWVRKRDFSKTLPSPDDVLLVIEVSDSTIRKDRGVKAKLYAEAGVQDYWIINVNDSCVEVHRRPHGSRFQSIGTYNVGDVVSPLSAPEATLALADIVLGEGFLAE